MNNTTFVTAGIPSTFSSIYDSPVATHLSSLNSHLHSHSHAILGSYHPQAIFEHTYRTLHDSLTPYQMIVWVSFTLQVTYYLLLSLPSFLFPFIPSLQKYKIQANRAPVSLSEQWKVLKHVFLSKTFMILPTAIIGYELFHYVHYDLPISYDTIAPWWVLTARLVASLWIEDSWHYLMHRALHHPAIYGYIHKVHHTYAAPFSFAAEYAHPAETLILAIGFFIPLLLFFDHLFFFWIWLLVRMWETADVHSGYDVPWMDYVNVLHLLPFYGGARFHDYHHKAFNVNYASTFYFWDWVFGTDKMYQKHNAERKALADKKQGKVE
jgi:methylsterol monooxygenase